MPRPRKQGLDFFIIDTDAYHDDKWVTLRLKGGLPAVTIAHYLLAELYRVGCCFRWNDDSKAAFKAKYFLQDEDLEKCINAILESGLLVLREGYLTSKGIQKRYFAITKRRAFANSVPSGVLYDCYNVTNISATETRVSATDMGVSATETIVNAAEKGVIAHSSISLSSSYSYIDKDKEGCGEEKEKTKLTCPPDADPYTAKAYEVLDTQNTLGWDGDNRWILTHRLPMRDYPAVWFTVEELVDVMKDWVEINPTHWKKGWKLLQDFFTTKNSNGMRRQQSAYAAATGLVKLRLIEELTALNRLQRAKNIQPRGR